MCVLSKTNLKVEKENMRYTIGQASNDTKKVVSGRCVHCRGLTPLAMQPHLGRLQICNHQITS
jgi:hypothetical protein